MEYKLVLFISLPNNFGVPTILLITLQLVFIINVLTSRKYSLKCYRNEPRNVKNDHSR